MLSWRRLRTACILLTLLEVKESILGLVQLLLFVFNLKKLLHQAFFEDDLWCCRYLAGGARGGGQRINSKFLSKTQSMLRIDFELNKLLLIMETIYIIVSLLLIQENNQKKYFCVFLKNNSKKCPNYDCNKILQSDNTSLSLTKTKVYALYYFSF